MQLTANELSATKRARSVERQREREQEVNFLSDKLRNFRKAGNRNTKKLMGRRKKMNKSPCEIVQRTCGRGIGSFEFDDGSTRWQTHAAITNNSKAANDKIANAWRVAA